MKDALLMFKFVWAWITDKDLHATPIDMEKIVAMHPTQEVAGGPWKVRIEFDLDAKGTKIVGDLCLTDDTDTKIEFATRPTYGQMLRAFAASVATADQVIPECAEMLKRHGVDVDMDISK
jgi:hypothetical protein